jgi:hypothetical protein
VLLLLLLLTAAAASNQPAGESDVLLGVLEVTCQPPAIVTP